MSDHQTQVANLIAHAQDLHPQKTFLRRIVAQEKIMIGSELDLSEVQTKNLDKYLKQRPYVRKLTEDERKKKEELLKKTASISSEEQRKKIVSFYEELFEREFEAELEKELVPQQLKRFKQLYVRQRHRTQYDFYLPLLLKEKLDLTKKEQEDLKEAAVEAFQEYKDSRLELARKMRKDLLKRMSMEQRGKLQSIIGERFDFAKFENEIREANSK